MATEEPTLPQPGDSPSHRTRSRTTQFPAPSVLPTPPGASEPVKKRGNPKKSTITNQTDAEVWNLTNEAIIGAHKKTWHSPEYDHYIVSLRRREPPEVPAKSMDFVFTCHTNPNHIVYRARMGTSQGTTNLKNTRLTCESKQRESSILSRSTSVAPSGTMANPSALSAPATNTTTIPYSEKTHRALIAIRCARNYRPFNSVKDPEYIMEVEMLRPGTKLPHPSTVSNDVRALHAFAAQRVRHYFADFDGVVHCAMDGWSSPLVASYLGVVISWWRDGKLRRATLDFLKLKASHTGQYQAETVYRTFEWFGLLDYIHTMCMDNASNCDTTARSYAVISPRFLGGLWRTRCTPHEVQLMARAFLSYFWQPGKPIPSTSARAGGKRKAGKSGAPVRSSKRLATPSTSATESSTSPVAIPVTQPPNDDATSTEEAEDVADANDTASETIESFGTLLDVDDPESQLDGQDPAQIAYTANIIQEATKAADQALALERVKLTAGDKVIAQGILSKASGLARKVNESPTLKSQLDRIVQADISTGLLQGNMERLPRRVATRWNSDLHCLRGYLHLFTQVKKLVAEQPSLEGFLLTPEQHILALELVDALEVFEEPTRLFSSAEMPLIHEVVPMLEDLAARLGMMTQGSAPDGKTIPKVIRLAAQAALVVLRKYETLGRECEVYEIAMVMCPHWKLDFFKHRGRNSQDIERIRARVVTRFYAWNPPPGPSNIVSPQRTAPNTGLASQSTGPKKSIWSSVKAAGTMPVPQLVDPDTIEHYLSEPRLEENAVNTFGGVLHYWESQKKLRPRLAKLALAYLSAPASSVDAERAFSSGRLMVNHTQHNLSSNSFVSQVVLGSWIREGLVGDYESLSAALDHGSLT